MKNDKDKKKENVGKKYLILTLLFGIFILLGFNLVSAYDWNFSNSSDYVFNTTEIVVSGGNAFLNGSISSSSVYAWWHLNENTGTTTNDSSGNNRTGTLLGNPTWVTGKLGASALQFNGANQYVDFGNSTGNFERTQAFSIELWFKTSSTGTGQIIISKILPSGSFTGWEIFYDGTATNNIYFDLISNVASNYLRVYCSPSVVADNNWHHLVVVYDGTSIPSGVKFYFDGALKTTGTTTNTLTSSILTSTSLQLDGRNSGATGLIGSIDEVVIYNGTLTSDKVTARYNSGNGTESPVPSYSLGYYSIQPKNNLSFSSKLVNFTETAIKTNSDIQYCISNDTTNFKFWNGSSWVASNSSWLQSNNASDINSNIQVFANSGNFSFKAILHSNDGSYSPYLDNIFVSPDITSPICVLVSRNPSKINDSSTGNFNVIINCSDSSGINTTKTGDHYWMFITRTLEENIIYGLPNYWSVRYPNNSLSVIDPVGILPKYKVLRAEGRNIGRWFENLSGFNNTILNDTFSYVIDDGGNFGDLSINVNQTTNTSMILNITGLVEVSAFRQMFYLDKYGMGIEIKKNWTVNPNNPVLVKLFDFEATLNSSNYTMNIFRNLGYASTIPTVALLIYYCNSSYNVSISNINNRPYNSPNCVQLNSLLPMDITSYYNYLNSSYTKETYSIVNGKINGIVATPEYYFEYQTASSKDYYVKYANGTNPTDVSFKNANVSWTSINGGTDWVRANWTSDVFTTTTKKVGDEFQFGIYVCDLVGNCYSNFTFFKDIITQAGHPISRPYIFEYNSSRTLLDLNLNGLHNGTMNILIYPSIDPDSIGNVTHNLTLRNLDGTYNYTINGSFKSLDDSPIWIDFNTSKVPDGKYKMNILAIAGDNFNDTRNSTTSENFTVDNMNYPPSIPVVYNPYTFFYHDGLVINYTASISLYGFPVNFYNITLLDLNLTYNRTVILNNSNNLGYIYNSSFADDGFYVIKVTACDIYDSCSDGYSQYFLIDNTVPYGNLLDPYNNTATMNKTINFTIDAIDNGTIGNLTLHIFYPNGTLIYNETMNVNQTSGIFGIVYTFLTEGIYHWFYTIYDLAGNFFQTVTNILHIVMAIPVITISFPVNSTNYSYTITYMDYSVSDGDSCWYSLDNGIINISIPCGNNKHILGLLSNDGINVWSVYSNNSEGNQSYVQVVFNSSCSNPNITIQLDSYPYVDFNSTYHIKLSSFFIGISNIQLKLTNSSGNISFFNFTYDNVSEYDLNLLFTQVGSYNFVIFGDNVCPTVSSNITGTFIIRIPFNITFCGFQETSGTVYKNEFAYLTAEFTGKNFNADLDQFITPLGFKTIFKTPVFHALYRDGCGTLKLYEANQTYTVRLFDGQATFNATYSPANITKTYGTNMLLGKYTFNGTDDAYNVYFSKKDLRPYFWLLNYSLIIIVVLAIIISIILFFVIPQYPLIAFIFFILFTVGTIILRIVLFFWIG